jgi:hypothetical protein
LAKTPDPNSKYKAEAMAAARLLIARRIARFCTALSPSEFERLLDKMVGIHWKYDVLPHLDPVVLEEDDVNLFLDT